MSRDWIEIAPFDALERLAEGNRRFVSDVRSRPARGSRASFRDLGGGQQPFAIVLGCSDSRVPVEIVFDQGPGDLFVIRVAGNIVAPSQIGSIEFAAEHFGTRLVVVLGHSDCGAVAVTLEELERPTEGRSPSLRSIVDRIRPSLESLFDSELRHRGDALLHHAIRANIRASVNQLRHGSQLLERLVEEGQLQIVGAEYSLTTGVVDVFEGGSTE